MQSIVQFILSLFLFLGSLPLCAHIDSPWFQKVGDDVILNVDLFLSTNCQHCQKAEAFFTALQSQTPWISIKRHYINTDKTALEQLNRYIGQNPSATFHVPAFFFCNSYWVGFHEANDTGKQLLQALGYCHTQVLHQGDLTQDTIARLKQLSRASLVASDLENMQFSSVNSLFLMAFLNVVFLCVPFSLLFLLSVLWIFGTTRGHHWAIGTAFLSGLALAMTVQIYPTHTFLTYCMRFFALISGGWLLLMLLGIKRMESQKKSLTLASVFLTTLCIDFFQQTCTPSMPIVFAEWMKMHPMTFFRQLLHVVFYLLFYLLPYVLFIGLVDLFKTRLSLSRAKQWMTLFCRASLVFIALLLLIYPRALASSWLFFIGIVLAFMLSWYVRRQYKI